MATQTTTLVDTPEMTIYQDLDTATGLRTTRTVYKPGSPGDNQQQMLANLSSSLAGLENIVTNWGTATAAQKDTAALAVARNLARITRILLGQLGSSV